MCKRSCAENVGEIPENKLTKNILCCKHFVVSSGEWITQTDMTQLMLQQPQIALAGNNNTEPWVLFMSKVFSGRKLSFYMGLLLVKKILLMSAELFMN